MPVQRVLDTVYPEMCRVRSTAARGCVHRALAGADQAREPSERQVPERFLGPERERPPFCIGKGWGNPNRPGGGSLALLAATLVPIALRGTYR
jgi:hypothetical protein